MSGSSTSADWEECSRSFFSQQQKGEVGLVVDSVLEEGVDSYSVSQDCEMASPSRTVHGQSASPVAAGARGAGQKSPIHHSAHPHCSGLDSCATGADDCPHHTMTTFDAVMPHDLDFIPTR